MITQNRSSTWATIAVVSCILAAILLTFAAIAHSAVVETAATPTPIPVSFDWKLYLGIFLGGLAGARTAMEGIAAILRVFAKRTKTTIDDRVLALDEAALAKLDEFIAIAKSLQPPAPKPPLAPVAMLAVLLLGAGSLSGLSCAEVRPRGAAAVGAFLDCEAGTLPADTLADAVALATSAVMNAISGSGRIDAGKLGADVAGLKTDLGRCALAAAVAALATPKAPLPGAPASSALAIDGRALRSAFTAARSSSGWPAVHVAGEVL